MWARVLAVAAAICFVAAFTMATLLPPMTTLSEVLADIDHPFPTWLRTFVTGHLSDWVWINLFMPILGRPDWLLFACFGVIFAGAALTLSSRKGVTRSHRRRS